MELGDADAARLSNPLRCKLKMNFQPPLARGSAFAFIVMDWKEVVNSFTTIVSAVVKTIRGSVLKTRSSSYEFRIHLTGQ